MNIIKVAENIINSHEYRLCEECINASPEKEKCTEHCLPILMFAQMHENYGERRQMLDNALSYFDVEGE